MASTATYRCKTCGSPFKARTADRARGWAKFCSKSCKATKQAFSGRGKSRFPRHDGLSPMRHKHCEACGEAAVNGIYELDGRAHWYCESHMAEYSAHPFSSEALQP